jgi:hypothetical protein
MSSADDRERFANVVERFVEGKTAAHECDDEAGIVFADPFLERIRRECWDVPIRFPFARRQLLQP